MPASLPSEAAFYILVAGGKRLGFILDPFFPTPNSLVFQAPLGMDKSFFDGLNEKGGYLPLHGWSLILVNTALQEVRRYTWNQTKVDKIRFPAIDNQSPKPLRFTIHLGVTGVTQGSPAAAAAVSSYQSSAWTKDVASYAFQLKIDGLLGADWSVSRLAAFDVGAGVFEDLVLTITPEGFADPFRDWLRNGNPPRTGSLNFLGTNLQIYLRIRFAGLRVRTIVPAISTLSSSPATARLAYSEINFGVDS
ncbi:MAG: hypothetical protein ABJF23_30455 [Bryobacteraceae bacterium]